MMLQYDRVGMAEVQPSPAAGPLWPAPALFRSCPGHAEQSRNGRRRKPLGGGQSDKRAGAYLRTLTIILRMAPSPTIGAWASSGSRIVNCPGRSV